MALNSEVVGLTLGRSAFRYPCIQVSFQVSLSETLCIFKSRLQNTSKVPKMVHGLRCLSYEQRLRHLERTTLKERRITGDLIETFKIMTGKEGVDRSQFFQLSTCIS